MYKTSRQTLNAKVQCQEGNSPDHMLRSQSFRCVGKEVFKQWQPADWLGSSHSLKKA